MILYIENPKDAFRKLLELMNEYSKGTRYETNAQKSLAFLYTNKEKSEGGIEETNQFTISTNIEIRRNQYSSVQFSHSVVSESLLPHELQQARPPCPSPAPGVHQNSCGSSQ